MPTDRVRVPDRAVGPVDDYLGTAGMSEMHSIPAQREAGTRKAEELRAKVVAEFSDPGITGRSDRRPGLQALLERIRTKGDIDLVIVWKLSRMSRSPPD